MTNCKIIIAGGSGFIGEELIKYFGKNNHIIVLTRKIPDSSNNRNTYTNLTAEDLINTKFTVWDAKTIGNWCKELENADLLINLAGKSVNCRYTQKNKQDIVDSRVSSTKILGEAILQLQHPPKLWINSSSATIYRHATDKPQDEYTGEIKTDFSVQVCKKWEEAFYQPRTEFTRKIALRMAITLGAGGVMIPYYNLLKFGLGGKQGNGEQMYSWIHITDTCRIIEWLWTHPELEGTFNCSSPSALSNNNFMKTLREVTHTKFGLPAYKWMLQLGAAVIGTETELVLKSRWVKPTRLLESGFQFTYPKLKEALSNIIEQTPKSQYKLFIK